MKYLLRHRRLGSTLARVVVIILSGHLSNVAFLVLAAPADHSILGIHVLDARPLFVATTIVGVIYAFEPGANLIRDLWLVLFTCCTWGRALSLVFIGSPELRRGQELAGSTGWAALFAGGILAALVLTSSSVLSDVTR